MPEDLPPTGGGGGFSFTQKYGPLPAWGWLAVAAGGGYLFLKWRQRKTATGTAGAGASTTYVPYNPVDYSGGGGAIGGAGGLWSAPSSNLGTVTAGQIPTPPAPPPAAVVTAPSPPPVMPATPLAAPSPVNPYQIGQTVAAGESIVQSLFSPAFGWLNLTSKGGLYTSPEGDSTGFRAIGNEPYGGSYLGYVSTLPQQQQAAQMAQHGTFAPGGLSVAPNGAYTLTNTAGEAYSFPVT